MSRKRVCCVLLSVLAISAVAFGQGDTDTIARIIAEGKNNSQVWDHLTYLSDQIGPRLTGSTRMMQANVWTRDQFAAYGLSNAHLDKWGEIPVRFDRGPSWAKMIEPTEREFQFTARAWSAGTAGPMRGTVVKAPTSLGDLEAMKDELRGKWVLSKQPQRWRRRGRRGGDGGDENAEAARELRQQITEGLREAGIAGRLFASRSDIVTTRGVRGWRDLEYGDLPTDVEVIIRRIDYDAINSRLADGEEVEVEVNLNHSLVEGTFPVFNTIAEIPGTEWPEQVVIISGHLDSWDGPGSKGTQDNGTGSAVTLEAARILMAVGAKPKRTIRFILWSGEEQGLLGSRAYVKNLSDEEKANISAVFVDDGGTNYEGGVSCIASMEPMLAAAIAPVQVAFPDLPMKLDVREKMSRFGGSDHAPFGLQGIPAFFWMESGSGGREGKNYRFIHHTQHDTMRYAVPEYLVQSATCAAVTAYNLACADTLLPREVQEVAEEPTEEPAEEPWAITIGPVSGTWLAEVINDDGSGRQFTLTFEMSTDGRVRGTVESSFVSGKISKASFDPAANRLKFVFVSEGGEITYDATVNGDAMTGTVGMEDVFSADFKAKRVADDQEDGAAGAAEDVEAAEAVESAAEAGESAASDAEAPSKADEGGEDGGG